MININYNTPDYKLNRVKIGDEVIDEYESKGRVVKINKAKKNKGKEYTFYLDSRQMIYILSKAI